MSPRAPSTTRVFRRSATGPAFPPRGAANRPSRAGAAPADDRPARRADPGFCPSAAYAHVAPWSRSDWATVVRPSRAATSASSHPVTATSSGMHETGGADRADDARGLLVAHRRDGVGRLGPVEQGGGDPLGLGRVVARAHRDGDVAPGHARGLGRLPVALQPVARHREQDVGDVRAAADRADPFARQRLAHHRRPPGARERDGAHRAGRRPVVDAHQLQPARGAARRGPPPGASSTGRRPAPGRRRRWSRR